VARRRDVIVAVVIGGAFLLAFGLFALMMIGLMSGGDTDLSFAPLGGAVGIIEMYGVMDEYTGRPVIRQLDSWCDNGRIKAVVIHVNSPGGGTAIAQEIYDAILRLRDEKPVVVSMAGVAASGGYYIACAADRVVANPGTITGSIGTIMTFNTFEGAMDKLGIDLQTIKSGEFKDVGNYSRGMTDEEELMLKSVIMDSYEQFVDVVVEGRSMERGDVYALADGSIFTGSQAYNLGLVDSLGGLHEAIGLAGDLAGLGLEPDIIRLRQKESGSIWDLVGGLFRGVDGLKGAVNRLQIGPELQYLYR